MNSSFGLDFSYPGLFSYYRKVNAVEERCEPFIDVLEKLIEGEEFKKFNIGFERIGMACGVHLTTSFGMLVGNLEIFPYQKWVLGRYIFSYRVQDIDGKLIDYPLIPFLFSESHILENASSPAEFGNTAYRAEWSEDEGFAYNILMLVLSALCEVRAKIACEDVQLA